MPITNSGKQGTDTIQATVTVAGKPLTAPGSITWARPVDCAEPVSELGYVLALECEAENSKVRQVVDDVLETAGCAVSIASFFVPAGQIYDLLNDASTVIGDAQDASNLVGSLQTKAKASGITTKAPVLSVALDLAQLNQSDNQVASELLSDLAEAQSLSDFFHDITNIISAAQNSSEASVEHDAVLVGQAVFDLLGAQDCAVLLGKIVTAVSATPVAQCGPPGPMNRSSSFVLLTSISPCQASPDGGGTLTLTGAGLGSLGSDVWVYFAPANNLRDAVSEGGYNLLQGGEIKLTVPAEPASVVANKGQAVFYVLVDNELVKSNTVPFSYSN